jgi:glycosyltransferase involved in cell wall biosynthesis
MTANVLLCLDKLAHPNTGMGQFSLHLARALTEGPDDVLAYTFLTPRDAEPLLEGCQATLETLTQLDKEKLLRWTRPFGPVTRVQRRHVDVWHALAQDAKYLPLDPETPVLLTIHDLNYLRESEGRELVRRLGIVQSRVNRARAIVADSRFTADEIGRHLTLGDRPLQVIYCGVPGSGDVVPRKPERAPTVPFLFAIGDVVPRKNFHVLLPMMELLPDLQLVLAGRCNTEYAADVARTVDASGQAHRVWLVGEVTDAERLWLYQHAEGVVVPSLTEGFGLPVIEGMAQGRPVFMSNATSLPEVGGESGHYWDSYEPEHMAGVVRAGLGRWHADPTLAQAAREHASRFTWRRAAEAYAGLYRSMLR